METICEGSRVAVGLKRHLEGNVMIQRSLKRHMHGLGSMQLIDLHGSKTNQKLRKAVRRMITEGSVP